MFKDECGNLIFDIIERNNNTDDDLVLYMEKPDRKTIDQIKQFVEQNNNVNT